MTDIVVALIALFGTLAGSLTGVLASSRLTTFRLKQLEDRVNRHNNLIERIYVLEEKVDVANHRLTDLERHEEQRS